MKMIRFGPFLAFGAPWAVLCYFLGFERWPWKPDKLGGFCSQCMYFRRRIPLKWSRKIRPSSNITHSPEPPGHRKAPESLRRFSWFRTVALKADFYCENVSF